MKKFFWWYLCSLIGSYLLIVGILFYYDFSSEEISSNFGDIIRHLSRNWMYWIGLLLPYILFRLIQYLVKSYKALSFIDFLKRVGLWLGTPIIAVIAFFQLSDWYVYSENFNYQWDTSVENKRDIATNFFEIDDKQRGVHLFGRVDTNSLKPLIKNNVEWITLVPFGGQNDYDSPEVNRSDDPQRRARRDSSLVERIAICHAKGFKVFLKPHIWISTPSAGKWRSDIFPKNEAHWITWSKSYRQFILHYAHIAEQNNVALFCIGTEFSRLVLEKPDFWRTLIADIRAIYKGKLTYAANWNNEFEHLIFWEELDYIGIQAYFPIAKNKYPSVEELIAGWQAHLTLIENVQQKFGKKILFTELGYKSTNDSAIRPWEWSNRQTNVFKPISNKTQANCYAAFFQVFWKKEWFAGIHLWQWRGSRRGNWGKHDFTPQEKPAENIIAKGFGELGQKKS